jgi:hypothetical protein
MTDEKTQETKQDHEVADPLEDERQKWIEAERRDHELFEARADIEDAVHAALQTGVSSKNVRESVEYAIRDAQSVTEQVQSDD